MIDSKSVLEFLVTDTDMLKQEELKTLSSSDEEVDSEENGRLQQDLSSALDWKRDPQSARDALERYRLKRALAETDGTVTDVADIWEVTKRAVYKMCYKHEVKPKDFRSDADG